MQFINVEDVINGCKQESPVFSGSVLPFWWLRPKMYLFHSTEISPDPVIQSAVYEKRNNYTCQGITSIIHPQLCSVQVTAPLVFMAPPHHSLLEKQDCIMPIKVDIPGHH